MALPKTFDATSYYYIVSGWELNEKRCESKKVFFAKKIEMFGLF